jgi:hypothetical protein
MLPVVQCSPTFSSAEETAPASIWVSEINGNGYANIAELRMINTNC